MSEADKGAGVAKLLTGTLPVLGQVLVTLYEDDSATIAVRSDNRWGPPIPLDHQEVF